MSTSKTILKINKDTSDDSDLPLTSITKSPKLISTIVFLLLLAPALLHNHNSAADGVPDFELNLINFDCVKVVDNGIEPNFGIAYALGFNIENSDIALTNAIEIDLDLRPNLLLDCSGTFDRATSTLSDTVRAPELGGSFLASFWWSDPSTNKMLLQEAQGPLNTIRVRIEHIAPANGMCLSGAQSCGAFAYRFFDDSGEPASVGFTALLDSQFRFGGNPINPTCSWDGLSLEMTDIFLQNETDYFRPESGKFTVDLPCGELNYTNKIILDRTIALSSDETDSDADGLSDDKEVELLNTNPNLADTDGDGLDDKRELNLGANPTSPDTDGDGLSDIEEITHGTRLTVADTDNDGLTDAEEIALSYNPLQQDADGDLLLDNKEFERGTDPNNADSDGDGISDVLDDEPLIVSTKFSDIDPDVANASSVVGEIINSGGHSILIEKVGLEVRVVVGNEGGDQVATIQILGLFLEFDPGTEVTSTFG